ncbi:UNVERIFIED_CONTAM: hypothetical protein Scaly_0097700 [Sesamum calycinum]|uniref:Uncharacterized protein n=1 Tax=Sesamum calycinum TaxID=2727403 RepID=A0AAW2SVQ2_9LAMI
MIFLIEDWSLSLSCAAVDMVACFLNLNLEFGLRGEAENLKFYSKKGGDRRVPSSSSSRKAKRKWKSREERSRRIDKEYDVVLVPSDGVCLSGSESDDSDWHNFQELEEKVEEPSVQFLSAVKKLPNDYSAGGREYMERWLSSLHNF